MPGRVISVLNMKGGVGKTTISAHVMRLFYLYRQKKVLLIDFDAQFNLSQTVLTQAQYDDLKNKGRTIYEVMEPSPSVGLIDVAVTKQPPPATNDVILRLKQTTDEVSYLDLLPGNFSLVKYSIVSNQTKLDSVKLRFQRFVSQSRKEYDLVVIDCNPSSSFITMCALGVSDNVLVPVRPDKYSMLGLKILHEYVNQMADIDPKPEFNIVLNGIPRQGYQTNVEDELRADPEFGPRVLTSKLYESKILAASADYTGFATDKKVPYRGRVRDNVLEVVAELAGVWKL